MYSYDKTRQLPSDFTPGPYDVICARGKEAKNHSGNRFYRSLVKQAMEGYSKATNKYEKTVIVSSIIDKVRERSPDGGFVKQEPCGLWYEVGDHLAREKAGQNLRDGLSKQYKSSTKSKRRRRELREADLVFHVENMIQTNQFVAHRVNSLQLKVHSKNGSSDFSETTVSNMFTTTNIQILEEFKRDQALQQQFKEAEESQKKQAKQTKL